MPVTHLLEIPGALRQAGLTVIETRDWVNRKRTGAFDPIGCLWHHTASNSFGDAPSLKVCMDGRSDLPGPLCHLLLGRDGVYRTISGGRANHAGKGSMRVLKDLERDAAPKGDARQFGYPDEVDGNGVLIGVEVENDGRGEPWSALVLDAMVRGGAAISRLYGWSSARHIAHREWTKRKPDPAGVSMTWFRDEVAARVRPQEDELTPDERRVLTETKNAVDLLVKVNGPRHDELKSRLDRIEQRLERLEAKP